MQYPLPMGNPTGKTAAETRAAVGLLTRSIRIVSEGDTVCNTDNCTTFPPAPQPNTVPGYYFGGHTIVRQGFAAFHVQGVEFHQLGQGGKIGHYPVHFHVVRTTPPNTFVTDSSINESMTRWITVHGTSGVTLQRDVGYLSIGHGFYLEDAVETENSFYSNLGVFARAGVINAQNPRQVPGLLASSLPKDQTGGPSVHYASDENNPAVFWITNGWNDFQGNMAAGAGMCGVCFWEIPASISGPSAAETWTSYASEQTSTRTGSSPLKNFDGNFCTSAMSSFQTVGYTEDCPGAVGANKVVTPVTNPYAPPSTAANPACGPGTQYPLCPADYYPNINPGILSQATQCPATGKCDDTNPQAILCQESNETNCLPTIINDYTTSFHWAQYNFAAVWLRIRWHLLSNSVISDVQNAGLSFISGGDYTHSSVIKGLWELALKTVFVGQTQPAGDPNYAYSSDLGPFNSMTMSKLGCDKPYGAYCVSKDNSLALGGFAAFGVSQHMFNIYDGPADEDLNAFINIKKVDIGLNANKTVYNSTFNAPPNGAGGTNVLGIPKAVKADPPANPTVKVGDCYLQNAAIAWKQPNGFYYPPTFHSNNLFFQNVDIRHYVIDPFWLPAAAPATYNTDPAAALQRYCQVNQNNQLFNNFSAIDRQTVLTDDDGSLTGYKTTVSLNVDNFFHAPIEGIQCESDGATPEGGTARTSPYELVTTAVYPDAAQTSANPPANSELPRTCAAGPVYKLDPNWDAPCSDQNCFGVPLYREYLTDAEVGPRNQRPLTAVMPFIRMAGSAICQRESLTLNHGHYYFDLTASPGIQARWPASGGPVDKNIFVAGQKYDFFDVFAKVDTEQTFQMYVGPRFDTVNGVQLVRVNIVNAPLKIDPDPVYSCKEGPADGTACKFMYNSANEILTVNLNFGPYAAQFTSAKQALCVPKLFCQSTSNGCTGISGALGNLTDAERNTTCGYAGKDVDCPTGGCVGFRVTLPGGFAANNQSMVAELPSKLAMCYPNDARGNKFWNKGPQKNLGTCPGAAPLNPQAFSCNLPPPMR